METVVELRFDDAAGLERHWREHLSRGGAWLAGRTFDRDTVCALVIIAPSGTRLELRARVVFSDDSGSGLALEGFGPSMREQLEALINEPAPEPDPVEDDDDQRALPKHLHERLRNLSIADQHKVARDGEIHERIALERIYGKTVWAVLLQNPRLSHPEVARIARMGGLPRPLMELIVSNSAWLKSPEVRRALLANQRLQADQIPRILRLLPKHELQLVPRQSTYPHAVREAARRMLFPID